MSRYTGPSCRLCRREGMKLMLKGDRCFSTKCAMERRSYPPGQHGQRRRKMTQYGIQLREKQKLRRVYGVSETHFRNYFYKAERQKGMAGENFIRLLERRLDNVVYRLRLASSRKQARQMVSHGHILVDGRKMDIPSYQVKPEQTIEMKEKSRSFPWLKEGMEAGAESNVPGWLKLEPEKFKGKVVSLPSRQDIDTEVNEQLIVEFYSK